MMVMDSGAFINEANLSEIPETPTITKDEALAKVKKVRDRLKAAGKNPQEIQSNPGYIKAREALDAAVAKQNADRATADANIKPGAGGDTRPKWIAPDGTIFYDETSYLTYLDTLGKITESETATKLKDAEKATIKRNAREFLIASLKPYFNFEGDAAFLDQLSGIIDDYIKQDYDADTISVLLPQTEPYKQRFKGNAARAAAGLSQLSPAEYLQAEETYNEILKRYDLADLATRETFSSLIGGQVSAAELTDRVVNVYDRIRNADEGLKSELARVKELTAGGVSEKDFAKALLTGQTGAAELKRKITTAEISTEARQRNLLTTSATELEKLGVSREQARTGFEQIRLTQPVLGKLSEIYDKQTINAEDMQKELEREQFQGMQSERRRRLAEQETTAFMGQSGTASGISLGRKRKGMI